MANIHWFDWLFGFGSGIVFTACCVVINSLRNMRWYT